MKQNRGQRRAVHQKEEKRNWLEKLIEKTETSQSSSRPAVPLSDPTAAPAPHDRKSTAGTNLDVPPPLTFLLLLPSPAFVVFLHHIAASIDRSPPVALAAAAAQHPPLVSVFAAASLSLAFTAVSSALPAPATSPCSDPTFVPRGEVPCPLVLQRAEAGTDFKFENHEVRLASSLWHASSTSISFCFPPRIHVKKKRARQSVPHSQLLGGSKSFGCWNAPQLHLLFLRNVASL
jgi:hypothetical protein